jgi:hypothetical protein
MSKYCIHNITTDTYLLQNYTWGYDPDNIMRFERKDEAWYVAQQHMLNSNMLYVFVVEEYTGD